MRLRFEPLKKYYILIPILTFVLAGIGLLFIYSASNYSAELNYGDSFYYVKKQALSLIVGTVVMFIGMKIKTEIFLKIKWIIFALSAILLGLVFVPGIGTSGYGATRWLNLGFITIQPSEISKFGFIIFLAAYLSENPPVDIKNAIIPLLTGGIICGLIISEPNMSITVVVGVSLLIMIYIAGFKTKWMVVLFTVALIGGFTLILAEPYRMERLMAFIDPWQNPKDEGYQLIQSYYALGSGGLFGLGLFNSRQKYLFLPFAESDFIFSVIGEECGLIGCLFIIVLFVALILCEIKIARRADSGYYSLLVAGISCITALQTAVNLAVVTGCIPPTGVPLPLVSAGGTSLVTFMFVSGLVFNVARNHSK